MVLPLWRNIKIDWPFYEIPSNTLKVKELYMIWTAGNSYGVHTYLIILVAFMMQCHCCHEATSASFWKKAIFQLWHPKFMLTFKISFLKTNLHGLKWGLKRNSAVMTQHRQRLTIIDQAALESDNDFSSIINSTYAQLMTTKLPIRAAGKTVFNSF